MKSLNSGIVVCLVAPFPPPIGGMSVQAQLLLTCLRKDGCAVLPVPTIREGRVKVVRALKFARDLLRSILASSVVHVFSASYDSFIPVAISVVLARSLGRRVIITHHNGGTRQFLVHWNFLASKVLRGADAVTVPSQYLSEIFSQFGIPTYTFPNLVDTSEFEYVERRNISPRLVVTRHLSPAYGVADVLRVFRIIKDKRPDASLTVAGNGIERKRLERLARELHLTDVKFTGALSREKIVKTYRANDIFLNCSIRDNFPIAILEAAASGLPIVSTNVGGIPYIIQDGINGMLVEPGNLTKIANVVLELVENQRKSQSVARRAKQFVDSCTWQNNRLKWFSLYAGDVSNLPHLKG